MVSEFSQRLKQLRLNRDFSLRDLAERSRLSFSFIASLENGRFKPSRKSIIRLANALDVTPDELLILAGFVPQNDTKPKTDNKDMKQPALIHVPIVAEIACGTPMYTEDAVLGHFPVNPMFANPNDGKYVWVRANGDSMTGVRIFDGSLVLLRIQSIVDSGDIAAVCVDNENATLKRVYFLADGIMLAPENPSMAPVTYSPERVRIVGRAISVVSDL